MSGPPEDKTLLVHYVDVAGFLRQVEVPYSSLEDEYVAAFDGSSVYGIAPIERSDMLLKAVKETLKPVPWDERAYRIIAAIYEVDGFRSKRDPRLVAERALEYSLNNGYLPVMGAELEFFLFDSIEVGVGNPLEGVSYRVESREHAWRARSEAPMVKKAYHVASPIDKIQEYRLDLITTARKLGFTVSASHHEVAVAQMEASIGAGDPVELGDRIVTFKWLSRNLASMKGLIANFMPKPVFGDNGSGLHVHVSLWDREGRENLFNNQELGISDTARYFIGGILEHARSLAAIVSPTTNSYKRLVPGYEAPVYTVWGFYNRSAIVRVPTNKGRPRLSRIEYRAPDPSANPYLALAAILMAGLDGIKKKIDPGDPYEGNVYRLSREERLKLGIRDLPRSLDEALDELESDNGYLKPVFTKEILEAYIEVKREEAKTIRMMPHPYEIYMYSAL